MGWLAARFVGGIIPLWFKVAVISALISAYTGTVAYKSYHAGFDKSDNAWIAKEAKAIEDQKKKDDAQATADEDFRKKQQAEIDAANIQIGSLSEALDAARKAHPVDPKCVTPKDVTDAFNKYIIEINKSKGKGAKK